MNMKKLSKMLSITVIFILLLSIFSVAFGADAIITGMTPAGDEGGGAKDKLASGTGVIMQVLKVVGMAVALIILVALGIKYITASPGEKADVKKSAIIYVAAAILLFATSGILQIIETATTSAL